MATLEQRIARLERTNRTITCILFAFLLFGFLLAAGFPELTSPRFELFAPERSSSRTRTTTFEVSSDSERRTTRTESL